MPDFCMCVDYECPMRKTCRRFIAKPSVWQSYFAESPRDPKTDTCEFYWEWEEK